MTGLSSPALHLQHNKCSFIMFHSPIAQTWSFQVGHSFKALGRPLDTSHCISHFHSVKPANVQLNCLFVLICLSFFFQCSHIVAILSMQSFNSGGIFFLTKGKYCPWQLASNTIKLKKSQKRILKKCCCSTCRMQKYFRLPSKIQYMMYNSSVIILNVNTNQ